MEVIGEQMSYRADSNTTNHGYLAHSRDNRRHPSRTLRFVAWPTAIIHCKLRNRSTITHIFSEWGHEGKYDAWARKGCIMRLVKTSLKKGSKLRTKHKKNKNGRTVASRVDMVGKLWHRNLKSRLDRSHNLLICLG
jgi:hypothetical protein